VADYTAEMLAEYSDFERTRCQMPGGAPLDYFFEMLAALQNAGKSFDVQVGPDRGHSAINNDRMMEFFIENLVVKGSTAASTY